MARKRGRGKPQRFGRASRIAKELAQMSPAELELFLGLEPKDDEDQSPKSLAELEDEFTRFEADRLNSLSPYERRKELQRLALRERLRG